MSIQATKLRVLIGKHVVLSGENLVANMGEMTALVGPSGSGKTTLLNCLGLLLKPTDGQIYLDGQEAAAWPDRRRLKFWQKKAAFIYQDYGLISDESVAYNTTLKAGSLFRNRPYTDDRLTEILEVVGLSGRAKDTASVLSGGEKQRVGIARALYKEATYIFADEPTASLDAENREIITGLLRKAAGRGACVLIATHDERLASEADHVHTLAS